MSLTPFFSANGLSVGNLFNPTNVVLANGSITAGNTVTANYFIGNGALLTGIGASTSYSNANVAAYLPNYQGEISNIDFRSTSPAAVALVSNTRPLTMGGNTLSYVTLPDDGNANVIAAELTNHGLGNVLISSGPDDHEWIFDNTGNLTLPGNVWSVYYANGSQVPLGSAGNYGNSNVADYLASNANVTIVTTGNITGSYISGNGIATTTVSATPPVNPEQGDIWIRSDTGIQYIYFTSGGNSQWAEMEAAQSFSNGSGIVSGYSNADVAAYLNTGTASNILPSANVIYDIGSSTKRWKDIWLANSTIHLGSADISEVNNYLVLPANVKVGTALLTSSNGNLTLPANINIGSSAITSSEGNLALPANTTIGGTLALSPRISNVQIATSNWTIKDDTAVALEGGYIVINGSGFVTGATVAINSTSAVSATVVSSSQIRAQVSAQSAGSYVVYVVNPDGSVAILLNGLTYSGTPTWTTASPLTRQTSNVAFSIQLAATGATSYAVSAGNTLPPNTTLSSGGLLAGNVSVETDTVYSFSVDAIDAEAQESPRTFSLTVGITVADPYFYATTLLLPGTGANNANNNTFLDSSTNNFTVTRTGNTTQGTYSPYAAPDGYWSNYFDGSGDYLSCGTSSNLALGAGDFTIELWLNLTSYNANTGMVFDWRTSGGSPTNIPLLSTSATGVPTFYANVSSGALITGSSAIALNTWTHLAVVRNGSGSNNVTMYLNGVSIGTATNTANLGIQTLRINDPQGSYGLAGYFSNVRLVKGTAVYTTNFTPSTTPLTAIANTSLLTCQSNRFKDNSTNAFAITVNGDTRVMNFGPFNPTAAYSAGINGGSAYFDGTGDCLTIAPNAALRAGTGDFTIEAWIYPLNLPAAYNDIISMPGNPGQAMVGFDGDKKLIAYGFPTVISTYTGVVNQWTHIAVTRQSTTLRIFANGVEVGTGTSTLDLNNTNASTYIGSWTGTTEYFNGYISNLRVVKGTAVYTTNFTPPTAPVTAIANTSLLLNMTNAGITDATAKNVLETVGDAKISTVQSKYGGSSMAFDGTGDYLSLGSSVPLNLQLSSGDFTVECWVYLNGTSTYSIIGNLNNQTGTTSWHMILNSTYLGLHSVQFSCRGTTFRFGTTTLATGTWLHIAVSCSGTSLKCFVDGTQLGTTQTVAASGAGTLTNPMWIGASYDSLNGLAYALNGYIDDLRITRGVARYTSNFTPPNQAFPLQ